MGMHVLFHSHIKESNIHLVHSLTTIAIGGVLSTLCMSLGEDGDTAICVGIYKNVHLDIVRFTVFFNAKYFQYCSDDNRM